MAAFDIDPAKIGTTLGALEVQPISNLAASAPGDRVDIVLVAVPADAAQSVVDGAVAAGVRAILNFAPVQLRVPPDVRLSNVDLSMEVEYLTYSLTT